MSDGPKISSSDNSGKYSNTNSKIEAKQDSGGPKAQKTPAKITLTDLQQEDMLQQLLNDGPDDPQIANYILELREPYLSPGALFAQIGMASDQINNFLMSSAKTRFESHQKQSSNSTQNQIDQIQQAGKDSQKAADDAKNNLIARWFEAIFEVIGACIGIAVAATATVLSAGAAAVAVVGCAIGLGMAIEDLTDVAIQTANGGTGVNITDPATGKTIKLDVSISGLVRMSDETLPGWAAMSPADQDALVNRQCTAISVVMSILVFAGSMASSIDSALVPAVKALWEEGLSGGIRATASRITTAMKDIAEAIPPGKYATQLKLLGVFHAVGQGTTGIVSGDLTIVQGEDKGQVDIDDANVVQLQAVASLILMWLKGDTKDMTSSQKGIVAGWESAMSALTDWGTMQALVVANT